MEIRLEIISHFVVHLAHRTDLLQSATLSLNASSDNVGNIHDSFLYTHLHVVSSSSLLQHRWSLKAPLHWFLLAENLVKILQSYQTNKPWEYEWKTNNKNNVHKMPTVIYMEYNKFNVESSKYRNEIEKNNAPLNSHLLWFSACCSFRKNAHSWRW